MYCREQIIATLVTRRRRRSREQDEQVTRALAFSREWMSYVNNAASPAFSHP